MARSTQRPPLARSRCVVDLALQEAELGEELKLCNGCWTLKPRSDFRLHRGRRGGGIDSRCKVCMNAADKAWRERRKAAAAETPRGKWMNADKAHKEAAIRLNEAHIARTAAASEWRAAQWPESGPTRDALGAADVEVEAAESHFRKTAAAVSEAGWKLAAELREKSIAHREAKQAKK